MTGEVNDLKNRARYCLADLGPDAQDGLRVIGSLEFPETSEPLSKESEERAYELLDELRRVLEAIRSKIELGQPVGPIATKEATRNSNRSKDGNQSNPCAPYSKTDQALYDLIGMSNFYNLRNAEIMRWFGPMWRETRPGRSPAAFRSSLCRIRRHNQISAPSKNLLKD